MKRTTILLLLLVMLPVMASAGTTGKIAGQVKDEQTGEPLIGTNVFVEGTTLGAVTDLDGYFVILNVPPGKYAVVASAVGYGKKRVTDVAVNIDLTTKMDFKLSQRVVELGEEVIVRAQREVIKKDLTSSETRLDAAQMAAIPAREVREVLSLQSGVTVDKKGDIHIRGGRASEVGYWVNGISVSDVYDGNQAVQVDNNSIQELQVISGTFNAEYGQAMSGIVNIVTKDGDQSFRGSISAYTEAYVTRDDIYYNLRNTSPTKNWNAEASLSGPIPETDLTFYVSLRRLRTDGWLFGNKTFNTDGSPAPGVDSVKDAQGNFVTVTKGDNPVPMNWRDRWSGQFRLSVPISHTIKLSFTGVGSSIKFSDYDHTWRLNPDGNVKKYDDGFNLSAQWTHTLGSSAFYTINASFFRKDFKEYLYEDPFDPGYQLDPALTNVGLYEFKRAGTNLHQFRRWTKTKTGKFDYTDQMSQLHQIKIGLEGRQDELYFQDYNITPDARTIIVNGQPTNKYFPLIPPDSSHLYQEYDVSPVELSAYVQDKLEYASMIVNVGVRFDYFDSKGNILADPYDPNVYLPQKLENKALSLQDRLAKWYKKASVKTTWSPRFGISYPITDRGVLHFSYGHFLQIPTFIHLYQKPGYKVNAVDPVQGVYGNPDLNPQRTVQYEFGLQQQLGDVLSFDITGFYKDMRDWVSTSAKIPVRDSTGLSATQFYTMFINKDYANTRGVTLTLSKRQSDMFSVNLSYTFQTVEGLNSNADEEQGALLSNKEPSKTLTPLEWDQTHTANVNLGIGEEDWNVFILARYGSGLPYTPVINQAEARGEDAARVISKNSRRRVDQFTVDLKANKVFTLGSASLNVFLRVFNLFDRRNEVDVFGETGRSFATPRQVGVAGLEGINRVNTVQEYLVRSDYYSEPRQIQIGVDVNF